jgi:hypothetical protein
MKRRILKITITPVAWKDPNEIKPPVRPIHAPTQSEASDYLNKVFEKQLNVRCDVTVRPEVELEFSVFNPDEMNTDPGITSPTLGDYSLDIFGLDSNPELDQFESIRDANADINVYLIGASNLLAWTYSPSTESWGPTLAVGYASRPKRAVWINGATPGLTVPLNSPLELKKLNMQNTIAHEIGHILVGYGHPDRAIKLTSSGGPAPLPESDHTQRLMQSGTSTRYFLHRLVKGEWDEAENWLRARELGDN